MSHHTHLPQAHQLVGHPAAIVTNSQNKISKMLQRTVARAFANSTADTIVFNTCIVQACYLDTTRMVCT